MIVAVPVWNDRVSPVFDTAELFLVVRWEGPEETKTLVTIPAELPLPQRVERLLQQRVEAVICGAIWRPLQRLLEAQDVAVYSGVCGTVEEVLGAFRAGQLDLERFRMPGCRQRARSRWRHRKSHCRGNDTDAVGDS